MKTLISYLISILIITIFIQNSFSQVVWKSDGTVIGADGEIKKESYGRVEYWERRK